MARITSVQMVGRNVSVAIASAVVPAEVVAEAADLTTAELKGRLVGDIEFSAAELVKVGGFLHFRPSAFLEGVAA